MYPLRDSADSCFTLNKLKVIDLYLLQLVKCYKNTSHKSSKDVKDPDHRVWNHFRAVPTSVVVNTRHLMASEDW